MLGPEIVAELRVGLIPLPDIVVELIVVLVVSCSTLASEFESSSNEADAADQRGSVRKCQGGELGAHNGRFAQGKRDWG